MYQMNPSITKPALLLMDDEFSRAILHVFCSEQCVREFDTGDDIVEVFSLSGAMLEAFDDMLCSGCETQRICNCSDDSPSAAARQLRLTE